MRPGDSRGNNIGVLCRARGPTGTRPKNARNKTDKNKLETNTKTNEQSYVRGVGHGRQNTIRGNNDRVVVAE